MSEKRIPELDMAIRWKTFYDLLDKRAFRDEQDKGTTAAILCLSDYQPTHELAVRWKALCDILKQKPFKLDSPRRGVIAALLLLAVQKKR